MTAVPVWERVDRDQTMVEPAANLIRREGATFDPVSSVSQEVVRLLGYRLRRHADVLQGPAKPAGPIPGVREHPPVELTKDIDVENGLGGPAPA